MMQKGRFGPWTVILLSCALFIFPSAAKSEVVNFPDSNLEQTVREAIGKPSGEMTGADLEGLTALVAENRG